MTRLSATNLHLALARLLEEAAPAAAGEARRDAADEMRMQIRELRNKKARLNQQYKNRKTNPSFVQQRSRIDKQIADLQLKLSRAKLSTRSSVRG